MKFECLCDDSVSIQEYQNQITVVIPEFIDVKCGNGTKKIIGVDSCLVPELFWLWRKGIRTTGCCCGHNKVRPYIGVVFEDIQKMKKLGYVVHINELRPNDEDSFYPKTLIK